MRIAERSLESVLLRCLITLGVVSLLAVYAAEESAAGSEARPIKMVVPMYSNPSAMMPSIASDSSSVQMVILNPAVSQRFIYSSALASIVQTAEAAGIQVLGYVPSDYDNGVVPLNYSETLIADYASWYQVNGFFVDEVNTTCLPAPLAYYTSVSQFARSQPGANTIVMNLGGDAGSCYLGLANIFVTFENTYAAYLGASPPSWTGSLPASDFMNLVYDTPNATAMQNAITLALSRNVGLVYVTDENSANPYAGLPSYMQQESDFLESLTSAQAGLFQQSTSSTLQSSQSTQSSTIQTTRSTTTVAMPSIASSQTSSANLYGALQVNGSVNRFSSSTTDANQSASSVSGSNATSFTTSNEQTDTSTLGSTGAEASTSPALVHPTKSNGQSADLSAVTLFTFTLLWGSAFSFGVVYARHRNNRSRKSG